MAGCLGGEIGRHKGLKIPRLHGRAGSIPALGTNINEPQHFTVLGLFYTPQLSIPAPYQYDLLHSKLTRLTGLFLHKCQI